MRGGGARFAGNLDPGAREFRPKARPQFSSAALNAVLQPQIYYPYQSFMAVMYDSVAGMGYQQQAQPVVRPAGPPTRALLLSLVPSDVTEATVRRELEVFGALRAVEMEKVGEGIVTVHFYDVRHAQAALVEIQEQHMRQQSRLGRHYCEMMGRNSGGWVVRTPMPTPLLPPPPPPPCGRGLVSGQAVWAQFAGLTAAIPGGDGHNQGTLVVFNLDSGVSSSKLQEMFEAFGRNEEQK